MMGTPLLIRAFQERGIGQRIREDGPQGHITKAGTPTMGGITMVISVLLGYLAGHLNTGAVFTSAGLLVCLVTVGSGAVGFVDDWIKVSRQRSLGLDKTAKTLGLIAVALMFALLAVYKAKVRTDLSFTRSIGIGLGPVLWCIFAVLVILAAANAVNLTD